MALKRNEFIPQSLTTVYTSPSGLTDIRTGLPYNVGGLMVGDYFDLTEAEAQAQSSALHAGRYRFVQIDSGATAANIKQGSVGLLRTLALGANVVTTLDAGLAIGLRPVVFLATVTAAQVTAGAYVFVQEAGDATLQLKAAATATVGNVLVAATGDAGLVTAPTQSTQITYALFPTIVGVALQTQSTGGGTVRALLEFPLVQG